MLCISTLAAIDFHFVQSTSSYSVLFFAPSISSHMQPTQVFLCFPLALWLSTFPVFANCSRPFFIVTCPKKISYPFDGYHQTSFDTNFIEVIFFSKRLVTELFLWMIFHILSRHFRLTPLLHCINDTWSSVKLKHFRYWYLLTFEANEPFTNFELISAWWWAEFNHQHLPMLVCIWSSFFGKFHF